MNKAQKIVAGLAGAIAIVILSGLSLAHAAPGFIDWEKVSITIGTVYGNRLELPPSLPAVLSGEQEEQKLTAAGDTFGTQQIAQVLVTTTTEPGTGTASTSYGSLLNPTGGRTRIIRSLEFRALGTNSTYLGGSLVMDFGTSTQFSSSTNPIYSTTLTTSTDAGGVVIATSTFDGQKWKQLWLPGEYLKCQTNRVVSTTNGYCLATFVTLN